MLRTLQDYLAKQADQPFGNVELISGQTLQPFSFAGQEAARNLLDKARRALDEGDPDRAEKFVRRAARLPFDAHEQAAPAAWAAHMELFRLITDTLEASSSDDPRWLDAVVEVLAVSDESARYVIRDVLTAIDQDYHLESTERSRIRAEVAPIPDRAALRDLDLDATALGEHVLSILIACRDYQAALEASYG